jgi:hypothetical protein
MPDKKSRALLPGVTQVNFATSSLEYCETPKKGPLDAPVDALAEKTKALEKGADHQQIGNY